MAKFDELSKLSGMPITHDDMMQFVEVHLGGEYRMPFAPKSFGVPSF
jgi:hypothetical protein